MPPKTLVSLARCVSLAPLLIRAAVVPSVPASLLAMGCDKPDPGAGAATNASASQSPALAGVPTRATPLGPSQVVYDFAALAHTGQRLQLSEFLSKPVVVYFCPRDEDPVCLQLAESFREAWLKLNDKVAMVFAVSPEDSVTHREFVATYKLPALFLADTDETVHRAMGVKPGTVISFMIGEDRKVLRVFAPPAAGHAAEILAALNAVPTTVAEPSAAPSTPSAPPAAASANEPE